jgi:hypothetical protein
MVLAAAGPSPPGKKPAPVDPPLQATIIPPAPAVVVPVTPIAPTAPPAVEAAAAEPPLNPQLSYIVRQERWSASDERGYSEFIKSIGESHCGTVNNCMKGPGNPFRGTDPKWAYFRADCADLPYFLRAYYAWKRGLPFAYEAAVGPVGRSRDIRYSRSGNRVHERRVITTGSTTGLALLEATRNTISSAMYRMHPERDQEIQPDHYPARASARAPSSTIRTAMLP